MGPQDIFNALIGLGSAIGGWVLKVIWDSLKDLKAEIKELTLEVHQDFARRDDFKDAIKEIKEMLYKISDKLDDKADKSTR